MTEVAQSAGPVLIGLNGLVVSNAERHWLRHPAVGGVVLFTRNYVEPGQLADLTASIMAIAGRRLLICVDHEGGRVQRFIPGFTRLPPVGVLGQMYDKSSATALDFAYRHARVMATELRLCGVDLSFAPVLDINAVSLVIGDRAFAKQTDTIIELARAYIAGMHDAGMMATGKHFPGHGSVAADSHTDAVRDPRFFEQIEQSDLKPFTALSADLDAMMMAHVIYPVVDEFPAGYSAYWIQSVLRQKLAFSGAVFSDDLGMHAAGMVQSMDERVRVSLTAGCDAVLVCDPGDVERLLSHTDEAFANAGPALLRLRGRAVASRDELERVGEWRQWKESIKQLGKEQSRWT